jgi:hypothetical protein
MNRLKKKNHLNVDVKKCGSNFAKCAICVSLKDLISIVGKNNASAKEHEMKLQKHNIHQTLCITFGKLN